MRVLRSALVLASFTAAGLQARAQADRGNAADVPAARHKATAALKLPPSKTPPGVPLTPRERSVQMLNRFTFGPRPGEVERVLALGPDKWFEAQLNPASINDGALDNRLRDYPTLAMTPEQAVIAFPDRGAVQQVADGKRPYPTDPLLLSMYQVQVFKYQAERDSKKQPPAELTDADKDMKKKADTATAERVAGELFALPKAARMEALDAMPVPDRIAFANNLPGPQRTTLIADFSPREREALLGMQGGVGSQYRTLDELSQAKVLRSILSERQLNEVMTDFWFNHFNIFAPKDSDQWYTTAYERDAIRPQALGRFRDLLLATAESPAMMIYLDNWLSIGPDSIANGVDPAKPNSKPGRKGLNENYGREVMELHTVGVNGGYTQADVTHLAAILTGWGVDRPGQGGPFLYDAKKHEPGTKQWFGYTLDEQGHVLAVQAPAAPPSPGLLKAIAVANAPDGMKQGVAALCLLAASPKTAHFVSYLLAQRFVADEPPPALVDRMATAYLASDGDIKTVLRTLVASPELRSHRFFRNKVKTPVEFLASAYRATATDPQNPGALVGVLNNQFGEPLYRALPPTGYYITADHWMNTQSLLGRLNFADQLTHNKFANQKFDASRVLALSLMNDRSAVGSAPARPLPVSSAPMPDAGMGPDVALHVLEGSLIDGEISSNSDRFIHSQMAAQPLANPTDTLNLLTALLLGSPEFQLR